MNWSKAKTILIIAFLITNMVLALVLFSQENQEVSTIKESFIQDVVDILAKKNIYLNTEIPDEIPSLNALTVKYEMLDYVDINKRFFDGQGDMETLSDDKLIISKENQSVSIENNKKLTYKNNRDSKGHEGLKEDRAQDMVFSFLEERQYATEGMTLWSSEVIENLDKNTSYYSMNFSRMYNDRFLERTYTNVILDVEGVLELERLWLDPISEGETPIYINTAPKALLDLIGNEEVYGKTIEHISLCYYFDPQKDEYIEEPEETKEGKSIPAWRVTFDDGTKIIIDNY